MFKQIIVAMAGAIAAQITAATLDFTADEKHVSTIVPFLGAPQIVDR